MKIGIPREIKPGERRVGLTPESARQLAARGHTVLVEAGAGMGAGFEDAHYAAAGAKIVDTAAAWDADLVVKVKELQRGEARRLNAGSALFCFQHLPGDPKLTREIAARHAHAIAYEMVQDDRGGFPLLAPMSRIAGRMAIPIATQLLQRPLGRVLVLGAGNAGASAAEAARNRAAQVTVLRRADATPEAVAAAALEADLVVGAVFVPAVPTPKLLPRSLVARMKPGAVIVDISIDAGGVAETSRQTTHAEPSFVEEGVIHYCVANIPAAYPREATEALAAATLPYLLDIATKGVDRAVRENRALRSGVVIWHGGVTHAGIAAEAGLPCSPLVAVAA